MTTERQEEDWFEYCFMTFNTKKIFSSRKQTPNKISFSAYVICSLEGKKLWSNVGGTKNDEIRQPNNCLGLRNNLTIKRMLALGDLNMLSSTHIILISKITKNKMSSKFEQYGILRFPYNMGHFIWNIDVVFSYIAELIDMLIVNDA